jgi:hypothetical protein
MFALLIAINWKWWILDVLKRLVIHAEFRENRASVSKSVLVKTMLHITCGPVSGCVTENN